MVSAIDRIGWVSAHTTFFPGLREEQDFKLDGY